MKGNQITLLVISLRIIYGLPTEPWKEPVVYVQPGQNITLSCSAFDKALMLEGGRFSFLRWYVWTNDGVKGQWTFLAGMNEDRDSSVEEGDWCKGFNVSTDDGGLYIDEAQPCQAGKFICTVLLRSGRSPLMSNVTLKVVDENENRTTGKPEPTKPETTTGSKDIEKAADSPQMLLFVGLLIGALGVVTLGLAAAVIVVIRRRRSSRNTTALVIYDAE